MKKLFLTLAVAFAFFFSPSAMAGYLDAGWENITVYDGFSGSYKGRTNKWWNTNEDQEVEPGAATGQKWDLEGFFLSDGTGQEEEDQLAMVGGFNFSQGQSWVDSGDIFIDTDMETDYYDYVLDLEFMSSGPYTYTVYRNDGSMTYKPTHGGPSGPTQGQPWTVKSAGTATIVEGYDNIAMNFLSGLTNSEIGGGLKGGKHNAVVVDVSFLGPNMDFEVSSVIECGNDFVSGSGTTSAAVPEPATIFLLGSGLLGLFGFRKRIKKINN